MLARRSWFNAALSFIGVAGSTMSALAQDAQGISLDLPIIGIPEASGVSLQPAMTELAVDLHRFDNLLLWVIIPIVLFVTALLAIVAFRFNKRANPTPAKFTHNTPIEIIWTVIPIIILLFIITFSIPLLYKQQVIPRADITIKATGHQWFWEYEYVDYDGLDFQSYMIGAPALGGNNALTPETEAELIAAGYTAEHFTLATDTSLILPVNKQVVLQVTAADVIHSWTIPAFGVKQDGVPGRLAELHFRTPDSEGVYFGQCSELCGQYHAYMPITVKIVSQEVYDDWIARETGGNETAASQEAPAPAEAG